MNIGTVIDVKLSWDLNTGVIYRRGLQPLYFMSKLRQCGLDRLWFSSIVKAPFGIKKKKITVFFSEVEESINRSTI